MKKIIYIALLISMGFAVERTVVDKTPRENKGLDGAFVSATQITYLQNEKRGVFGQDDLGKFFSLYEKDPNHPEKTIIKFVRAKEDRDNKNLLEYIECDSGTMSGELKKEGLFLLTAEEVKKRLMQDGPTY